MNEPWPYKTPKAELDRRREKYVSKTGIPGRGAYLAVRAFCDKGHPLIGENLVIEKRERKDGTFRQVRRCRACLRKRTNEAAARRRGEKVPEEKPKPPVTKLCATDDSPPRRKPEKAVPVKRPAQPGEVIGWPQKLTCKKAGHVFPASDLLVVNGRKTCPRCLMGEPPSPR